MTFRFFIVFLFLTHFAFSQNNKAIVQKAIGAKRIESKIEIDGILDENDWKAAIVADSFIIFDPVPGELATENSHIKILYDNDGFYVGAFLESEI